MTVAAGGDGAGQTAGVEDARRVHPVVERLAAYGWRLLVIAAVLVGVLWLVAQLWVLLVAGVLGLFLTRALMPVQDRLVAIGAKPALASLGSLLVLVAVVGLAGWLVVPRVAEEFQSLGPTLTDAVDDLERWLVEDSPFDLSQADVDSFRDDLGEALADSFRTSGDSIVSGALVAVEVVTGLFLAIIAMFFLLKDGWRLQRFVLARTPPEHRELTRRMARRAWATLGGYLRGAAALGLVEGAIIGITMAVLGAQLALPVAVLTFAAAFVPFVGAIVAGVVAVLVTLTTSGFGAALVVAGVALVVQQLDNDLLAPLIYGRTLSLHPLVILAAVVGGGALFGFGGTVLAVPITAVAVSVASEAGVLRARDDADQEAAPESEQEGAQPA